jgi:hypothetical protein
LTALEALEALLGFTGVGSSCSSSSSSAIESCVILRLLLVGAAAEAAALAFDVRRVGLGASSDSLATEEASEGAGDADGTLCLVDVDAELTALADRRGGIVCTSERVYE